MSNQLFLLKELVLRDFQSRYAGSFLGFLWPFLQPLWQLFLFSFVFSWVLKIPLDGARTENFGIFLFCGLLPWMAVNEGIMRSATAVTDNANLVKHVRFEPEILVLAMVLSGLIQEGIALLVFFGILAAYGELALTYFYILVVVVPLQVCLTLGIGFFACAVHTYFRDAAQIVPMLLMGWFYFTPIVYPLGVMGDNRHLMYWNPLTALVEMYREALLPGPPPTWMGFAHLAVFSLGILLVGGWLFRRLKPGFADEV